MVVPTDSAKTTSSASSTGASTTSRSTPASTTHKASSKQPDTNASNIKLLAQTTEFRWYVAHVIVVVSTLLTLLPLVPCRSCFYRLGFTAALTSFVIILVQKYQKQKPNFQVLAHDDNFQYAVYSLFWLITPIRKLALVPLAIFSLFHTLTYTRSHVLPAIHRADSPISDHIDNIVKKYYEPFTVAAANADILLVFHLIFQAIIFAKGSWIQLAVTVAFVRIRFATSAYTRHAAKAWEVRMDQLFGVHPAAKDYWTKAKALFAKIPGPAQKTTTASK